MKSCSALAVLAAALLAACTPQPPAPAGCILDPPPGIGGPIALTGPDGAAVSEARFAGAPTLIYFGFTFCPDICPLALQTAKAALREAGPGAAEVQTALISLDPERDTPAQLALYTSSQAFPEGLIGLTGDTAPAAAAFKVGWRRSALEGSAADYLIDHTSFFYLMDAEWRLIAMFPSSMAPAAMAQCLNAALPE